MLSRSVSMRYEGFQSRVARTTSELRPSDNSRVARTTLLSGSRSDKRSPGEVGPHGQARLDPQPLVAAPPGQQSCPGHLRLGALVDKPPVPPARFGVRGRTLWGPR